MKRVKNLLATLLVLCASPALFACDAYVGGAIGIASFEGTTRAHNRTTKEHHFARGDGLSVLAGGQIGVEEYFENCFGCCNWLDELYGAFELNFFYNSYDKTVRTSTNTAGVLTQGVRVKNDFVFGADFKWGTRFCNTTPYIVTGYSLGVWDIDLLNYTGTTSFGVPAGGNKHNRAVSGFKLGTGVRYDVCDCVFFDMQYSYTWFGDIKRDFDVVVGEVSRQIWRHKVNVDQQRVVFGFNWTFGSY